MYEIWKAYQGIIVLETISMVSHLATVCRQIQSILTTGP